MQFPLPLPLSATLTVVALILFTGAGSLHAQILEDFEGDEGLGARWTAAGKVLVARKEIPEQGSDTASANRPEGKAMQVQAEDNFALYTKIPTPEDIDWTGAESLAFWVYQDEDRESRIDVIAMEPDRKAIFWRKCTFSGKGWQRVEMPLRWFRWEERRVPRWSEVAHFGIRGGGGLEFWIDGFELVDADPDAGSRVSLEEFTALAFPGEAADAARIRTNDDAWVLSEAPELDVEKLHQHLVAVRRRIEEDVPRWKRAPAADYRIPKLVVFKDVEGYRAFFERLGDRMLGTVVPPSSGGYHVLGVAVSYWDPEQGTLRPVYTHEFVHSFVSYLGLQGSSGSDWFQEGIATLYQLRANPQDGLSEVIREGLENEGYRNSLSGLCSGVGLPLNRYWQAMSVVDYLMRGEGIAEKFDNLLARMEETGSVDLREHLEPVYGIGFEELETGWMAFARENLEAYDPKP